MFSFLNNILITIYCLYYFSIHTSALHKLLPSYLCVSESILVVVDIQGGQEFLCSFPAVHKLIIWDGVWVQDAVSEQMNKNVLQDWFKVDLMKSKERSERGPYRCLNSA